MTKRLIWTLNCHCDYFFFYFQLISFVVSVREMAQESASVYILYVWRESGEDQWFQNGLSFSHYKLCFQGHECLDTWNDIPVVKKKENLKKIEVIEVILLELYILVRTKLTMRNLERIWDLGFFLSFSKLGPWVAPYTIFSPFPSISQDFSHSIYFVIKKYSGFACTST